jgi:hypothetical protein
MFKSRVFIFILLALAAFLFQLALNKGQLSGQKCCPPNALMLPSPSIPSGNR